MVVDVSAVTYFAPVIAFLIVFVVLFAVLSKTQLFGEKFPMLLLLAISFLVATLFISAAGVRRYVETIVPWFAVFVVSLVFLMALIMFIGDVPGGLKTGIGVVFVVGMILAFLISGIFVFSDALAPYLPGTVESQGNPVSELIYSSHVLGTVLLLVVAGAASWFIMKASK